MSRSFTEPTERLTEVHFQPRGEIWKCNAGVFGMFVRLLELDCKPRNAGRVCKRLEQKLAILKAQPGFVDAIILKSDTDENRLLELSIWKNKKHAER